MDPNEILEYCIHNLHDTVLVESWGEKGFFYNPQNLLKRGVYILTVKEKDGDNDKASELNRSNVYRVNMGVRKKTFVDLFGEIPKRPGKGETVDINCNFTELDKIIPHPVYSWMGWICVLNPSAETFEKIKPLIREAYEYATEKFKKRKLK